MEKIRFMTKRQLLKRLEKFSDDTQVCIFDVKKNMAENDGLGTPNGDGIYPGFSVMEWDNDNDKSEEKTFIALGFDNPDYNNDGELIAN